MNTAEIINSMKEHVAAAYTAVTGKNGTIPEQKNLSNLAVAIDSIQGVVLPALTDEGSAADLAKGKQLINSSGEIVTGTATIVPTPKPETGYFVKAIDYDGTELLSARGENGDSFTLPPAPSHDGLVFQG